MHTIRLHGPWLYFASVGEGKVKMPGELSPVLEQSFVGEVRLQRNFGCPTGIESTDELWLVFEQVTPTPKVQLNGELLGSCEQFPARFNVTQKLGIRNRIELHVSVDMTQETAALGEVRLEIHSPE